MLEPFAHPCGTERLLDFAGLAVAREIEQQLSRLGLEKQNRAVAHHDTALVVDQLERGDRSLAVEELAHPKDAALNRFEMAARLQQLLGQAHHQQIVKREAVVVARVAVGLISRRRTQKRIRSGETARYSCAQRVENVSSRPASATIVTANRNEYRNSQADSQRRAARVLNNLCSVGLLVEFQVRAVDAHHRVDAGVWRSRCARRPACRSFRDR